MTATDRIRACCDRLSLPYIPQNLVGILMSAQENQPAYADFLADVLEMESRKRQENVLKIRVKMSKIPARHDLDKFDFSHVEGLSERNLRELRTLAWMEGAYNVVLMGPSGTGKTFIASGLVYEAVKVGKKAYIYTMEEILNCLRNKDISVSAMTIYNRIMKADLLAIDDIMLLPVKKEEAASFFNLINALHEKTSMIITTNKSPVEWAQALDDEVLASALLDRLLYHCEIVKLTGASYRMENRRGIFESDQKKE